MSFYSVPPLEWEGRSYKWKLTHYQHPLPWPVKTIFFSQSRDGYWWMKLCIVKRYGWKEVWSEGSWQPVPGFGFVLPEKARLIRETAMLPKMTPEEWFKAKNDPSRHQD